MTLLRRFFPAVAMAVFFALFASGTAGAEPGLDKNGLHTQPWFKATSGDLRRDLAAAQSEGKILVLLWEQKGCPYCRKMHTINFQVPETVDYIKANFYVVQMNLWGERMFTDFDGTRRAEEELARAHRITATPTAQYYKDGPKEVFRLPGYAEPPVLRYVYEFVVTGGYETAGIMDWLKARMSRGDG